MAKFLYDADGLDKNMIGEYLGKDKEISQKVNQQFFN